MARYELIGKTLAHSFSKPIHEMLGAYRYHLHELPDEQAVARYLHEKAFDGCNVTLPYKQTVLPLLDAVDDRAARIGAVNTIVNRNGYLTGYNTDYDGVAFMLARRGISLKGRRLLLLGSGGTCRTISTFAQDAGAAEILVASRNPAPGQLTYEAALQEKGVEIIINTSPAGMYPHNGESLISPASFPALCAVADVVFNPLKTRLLLDAEALGIPVAGGLPMLVEQAVSAARLYTGTPFSCADTERVLRDFYAERANLVLIGMPSSGKSKLGLAVSRLLKKPFCDLDVLLEQHAGKGIPQIFSEDGESAFRRMETDVLAETTRQTGYVISTGGGVVTRPENIPLLRQNGVVLYLNRPLELLSVGNGRPLSSSPKALADMYAQRHSLYKAASDTTVQNNVSFSSAMRTIAEAFYEALDP